MKKINQMNKNKLNKKIIKYFNNLKAQLKFWKAIIHLNKIQKIYHKNHYKNRKK